MLQGERLIDRTVIVCPRLIAISRIPSLKPHPKRNAPSPSTKPRKSGDRVCFEFPQPTRALQGAARSPTSKSKGRSNSQAWKACQSLKPTNHAPVFWKASAHIVTSTPTAEGNLAAAAPSAETKKRAGQAEARSHVLVRRASSKLPQEERDSERNERVAYAAREGEQSKGSWKPSMALTRRCQGMQPTL